MAAGGSNRLAGDEQSGPAQMALFDADLYAPIAPACVAHGRKTAIEHGAQARCRSRGKQRERHGLHESDVHLAVDDVHVAIDEAWHQRPPATIDHGSILVVDRRGAQLAYPVVLNEQLMTADELAIAGLEELEVAKQDLVHGRTLARASKRVGRARSTGRHQLTTCTSPGRSAGKRSSAMARLASAAARSVGGWSTASLVRRKVPQWCPSARVAPHRRNASTASCGFMWLLRMNQRGS